MRFSSSPEFGKLLLIIFCLTCLTTAQLNGNCPSGWLNRPNSLWCYQMSDSAANYKSWSDAKKICELQHASLLSIADTDERAWLADKINSFQSKDRYWWFGLSRPNGTWIWDDGHTGNEQPGSLGSGTKLLYYWSGVNDDTAGNCMAIYEDTSRLYIRVWPRDCSTKYKYVCRKLKQEATTCDTDNQWELQNNRCYKLYNLNSESAVNWDDARSMCNAEESDLASIPDQDTNIAVRDILGRRPGSADKNFWIGLRTYADRTADGYSWRWVDETGLTYEAWNSGSRPIITPDMVSNTCVHTVGNVEPNLWKSYSCDGGRYGFLCSRSVGACPTGWYQHRDNCYSINPTELSWDEADTYCRSRNGSLLQIKQKHIQDFINIYKNDFVERGISYIWIGLYRRVSTDKLAWTTGGVADQTYTNWATNEPKLEPSRPNAIQIVASNDQGRWKAANPVDKGGYVCEIPLGKVPQEPTMLPPRYTCSDGWLLYGKNCYKIEMDYADWLTARAKCKSQYPGADLIDIRDAAEQEFIQGKLENDIFWIGLHTRNNEDRTWTWIVDGTRATYLNWNEGEPNNAAGEENCVEMYMSGKWNDDRCTNRMAYICKAPGEFIGSPPTPAPTTSFIWDPLCGPLWSRDVLTNNCYLFVTDPLIWVDAKHECEYQGGTLLSIITDSEKSYIAGRIQDVMAANPGLAQFWMGFNDRLVEGRWVWDDNQPVAYLNWAAGEPQNVGQDCAIIFSSNVHIEWRAAACQKRYASICKKVASTDPTTEPPATTISVPDGYFRGCRDGYTGFNNMCYKVYGDESDTISNEDAKQKCRMEGGDLASVANAAEHQFLMELAMLQGEFGFWIGFYDSFALQRTMFFQWTDKSPVTYTSWHIGEPNNHESKEDCVEIVNMQHDGWNGRWNDIDCSWKRRFACKQRQMAVRVTPPVTRPSVCPSDFDEAYKRYCLKFVSGSEALSANAAKLKCEEIGGTLATIPNQDVQNHFFLRITELKANSDFWIGLTQFSGLFRWDNRQLVTYTYWMPGVSLTGFRGSMSAQTGQWQMSLTTDVTYTNYICQTKQPGVTTIEPTYNPAYCAPGWIEADNTCYKGFSGEVSNKLSWTEARLRCKALNGDLATINSEGAMTALKQTIKGFYPYWIGLNTRDSNQGFVWANGKPAIFFKWRDNTEPQNINGNQNCALLNPSRMDWTIDNCNSAKDWLCETPKGLYPTGSTPEPTTPGEAPDCGGGWKYYNGSCYLFTSGRENWHNSLTYCRDNGGDLVSIHSHDENDFFVAQLSKMHLSATSYWIGLNELGQNDGFRWSDGTGANFFNWNTGEPDNRGGAEHCAVLYSTTGLWNDNQCGLRFFSICKKSNDTNKTLPPVTQMPGKCPKDFNTVGNKCYRLFDNVKVSWEEAKKNCQQLNLEVRTYLASVANEYEQAALTTLRAVNDTPLWIGLYSTVFSQNYMWHDNSQVSYTNWDYMEPDSLLDDCVEMYTEKFRAGKWNDASCAKKQGYICMSYKNPKLVTDWVPPTMVSCKDGWTAYGQACFLFVPNAATWQGALATCSSNGGNLASIHDLWEQNYVHFKTETIGRFSTWIGLSDLSGTGQYTWSDKWPVTYTNWIVGQLGQLDGGDYPKCVFMDKTGGWSSSNCTVRLPFMCRQSFGAEPTTVPHLSGTCPTDFVPFGDSCYYFGNNTELRDAQEAQYECSKRYRSTLVSILSQGEQDFVATQIRQKTQDTNQRNDYWIGLLRGSGGGFEWVDFSPVSYLYWSTGEPTNRPNENCVEMYNSNLKWNDVYCSKKNSYMCKMPKQATTGGTTTTFTQRISTSTTREAPGTPPSTQSTMKPTATTAVTTTGSGTGGIRDITDLTNDGLVAGIVVLFIIVLVAIVTAIFFYRRIRGPKAVARESGFTNANWSKSTDAVNLENSSTPRVQIQLDSGLENSTFSA